MTIGLLSSKCPCRNGEVPCIACKMAMQSRYLSNRLRAWKRQADDLRKLDAPKTSSHPTSQSFD